MGDYEILIFGNLDFAHAVLQGVASLANNDGGLSLGHAAATIFFLAILFAFVKYFLDPDKNPHPGKEFALGIILFVMFIGSSAPKVTVELISPYGFDPLASPIDPVSPPAYVVDDVPLIAAVPAYITTNLFYGVREVFKTEFVTPSYDGSFSANEALNALVQLHDNSYKGESINPKLNAAVSEYFKRCLLPYENLTSDGGSAGIIGSAFAGDLTDLWANLKITWDVPEVRLNLDDDPAAAPEVLSCPNAHQKITNYISSNDSFRVNLQTAMATSGAFSGGLANAYQLLTGSPGSSETPYELMVNSYMMYMLAQGVSTSELKNWAGLMMFEAQRERAYSKAGEASLWLKIMIPVVTALETFAFYIAPFVIIMAMAGSYGFKMVIGYFTLVVFVNMWGFVQIFTDWYTMTTVEKAIASLSEVDGIAMNVLRPTNYSTVVQQAESYITTAAALTAAVPMLSTFLLFGSVHSVMGVMRSLTSGNVDTSRTSPSVSSSMNDGAIQMGNRQGMVNLSTGMLDSGFKGVGDVVTNQMDFGATTSASLSAAASNIRATTQQDIQSFTSQFSNQVQSAYQDSEALQQAQNNNFANATDAQRVAALAKDVQQKYNVTDEQAQSIAIQGYLGGMLKTPGAQSGQGSDGSALVGGSNVAAASVGLEAKAQINGAIKNALGLSEGEMEKLQAQFGGSDKYQQALSDIQQRSEQWTNSTSDSSTNTWQEVNSWANSEQQAKRLEEASQFASVLKTSTGFSAGEANNVLGRKGADGRNAYDDIFDAVKQYYTKVNGGDENAALEQMNQELQIRDVGDVRRWADAGNGELRAVNAVGEAQQKLLLQAAKSGDAENIVAANAALTELYRDLGGRAEAMNASSTSNFFNRLAEESDKGLLGGAGKEPVNTSDISKEPVLSEKDKSNITAGQDQDVTRRDSGGQVLSRDDIQGRIANGKAQVESALEKAGAKQGYSEFDQYSMLNGWDKLKSAQDDMENQSIFNMGRLVDNLMLNLNSDELTPAQAYGNTLQQAAIEAGVGNAGAIGRGVELLMGSDSNELRSIALNAAQGDEDALGKLMDIRTASAFMASDVGSQVVSGSVGGVDDENRQRMLFNYGQTDSFMGVFNAAATGMNGQGTQMLDELNGQVGNGINRDQAITAMQIMNDQSVSNDEALRTFTMASNGTFGQPVTDALLNGKDGVGAFQEYASNHAGNETYVGDAGDAKYADFNDFLNQAVFTQTSSLYNEGKLFNDVVNPALDVMKNDISVGGELPAINGDRQGAVAIDSNSAMKELNSLFKALGPESGADKVNMLTEHSAFDKNDAVMMAGVYGDELRGAIDTMKAGAMTDQERGHLTAMGQMVDKLETMAFDRGLVTNEPGVASSPNGLSLNPSDARAIESGMAPDVVQANGEELQLVQQDGFNPVYENSLGTQFTYSNGELVPYEGSSVTSPSKGMFMDDMTFADMQSGNIPQELEIGTETLSLQGTFGDPHDPQGYIYSDSQGNTYYNSGFSAKMKAMPVEQEEINPIGKT